MLKQALKTLFLLTSFATTTITMAQFSSMTTTKIAPKPAPTATPPAIIRQAAPVRSADIVPVSVVPVIVPKPPANRPRTTVVPSSPPEFLNGAVCQGPYLVNYYVSGIGIEQQGIKLLQSNFKAHRPGAEIQQIDSERNSNLRVQVRVEDRLLEQWQEQSTGRIAVDRVLVPILREVPWSRTKGQVNRGIDIYRNTRDDMPTINYIVVSAKARFGVREAHESIVIATREHYTHYTHDLGRRLVEVINIGDLVEGIGKTKRTTLGIVPYYQLRMVLAEIVFERVMFMHDLYKDPFKLETYGPWRDHKMNYAETKLYRMVYEKGYKDFDGDRADQKNIVPRVKISEEPQCKPR